MADAVALDGWSAGDVRLGTVLDTLAELRRSVARTASRVWVMTLVIVAITDDEAYQALQAVRSLGVHHPARVLVLRPDPASAGPAGVDAQVTLYGAGDGDHQLTFDEVVLTVRGEASAHLDSIAEPFTLSDLPVVLWYPATPPDASDPLLTTASAVLVDTKDQVDLSGLAATVCPRPVIDMSWMRLRPWRSVVAALFDPPGFRPYVTRLTSIEVAGKGGPRHLLAGWLSSRLSFGADRIRLRDARHAGVVLEAGDAARFAVTRATGERVVRASASISGGPTHHALLPLPDDSLVWSLSQALTHLGRDPVWEEALAAAVKLADHS
ncbi:MAG: glucose-6-phosphate dehydrogenase assembly protein OpcA [Actinomycetota bacterium]|nr:glucose-6-phosphate dehydrogenase assembly protein OpcA [Actinomycetota bacterium]